MINIRTLAMATILVAACSRGGCNPVHERFRAPEGPLAEQCITTSIQFQRGDKFGISLNNHPLVTLSILDVREDRVKVSMASPRFGVEFDWNINEPLMIGSPIGQVIMNACSAPDLTRGSFNATYSSLEGEVMFVWLDPLGTSECPITTGAFGNAIGLSFGERYAVVQGQFALFSGQVMCDEQGNPQLSVNFDTFGIRTRFEPGSEFTVYTEDYGNVRAVVSNPTTDDAALQLRIYGPREIVLIKTGTDEAPSGSGQPRTPRRTPQSDGATVVASR